MKIPKTLKIGGHTFAVKFVSEVAIDAINTESDMGSCDLQECIIYLSDDQNQSRKEAVLIHEILHAINPQMNHTILTGLAEQLYQVLSDNKMLK